MIKRCHWAGNDPEMVAYHDNEWGKEHHDDSFLFEFMVLQSAQAGLSWSTILHRRNGYRNAFADFDFHKVAAFDEKEIEHLLQDKAIIRNRMKIVATIKNALAFSKVVQEFGSFYNYLYSFMPDGKSMMNNSATMPATTPISDAISKDMKKRGFNFFGSTICYAYMQSVGMVNDHEPDCSFK